MAKKLGFTGTFTGNSVAGRSKIAEIISLCDLERIEYKYYKNGFDKTFYM